MIAMVHSPISRAAVSFLLLTLLIATYPLLLGRFYAVGDMADVFIPLEQFFHTELQAGRLPVWDPAIAWGFPVIASAQIGFFYPPLLLARWLPLPVYLPLILFLHLFSLSIGTYLFARHSKISQAVALMSALSMSLSTFVWQHLTHLNVILTLSWLPWQFLALQKLAAAAHSTAKQRALPPPWAGLATITLAAPFLAGHLQIPALMLLITAGYYFTRRRQSIARAAWTFLPVVLLAGALTAIQVFPTLELVQYSSRGAGGDFALERANQLSWPIYHLPTILFPRFFGTDNTYWGKRLEVEYGIFIGTLPLLLVALTVRSAWRQHRFFVVAAGVGFLLALGNLSPIRLLGVEPSLWYFSAPARWLLLYTFAMSILAGAGLDTLRTQPRLLRRGAIVLWVALVMVVALYNLAVWNAAADVPPRLTHYFDSHSLLGQQPLAYYELKFAGLLTSLKTSGLSATSKYTYLPLITLGLAALFAHHRRLNYLLVALTAAELIAVAATATPSVPWSTILKPPVTITQLPPSVRQNQARIFSVTPPGGDTGLYLTNPATRPNAAERELRRNLLMPALHARFNIAGSQWPASLDLQIHNQARQELSYPELNIGAVLKARHGQVEITPIEAEPRVALVTVTQSSALPYSPLTPTQLRWQVTTPDSGRLIIRDTFYPGWQATIDGRPQTVEPYHAVFRQIAVPAGEHTITMSYHPISLYWGAAVTISASLILLITLGSDTRYRQASSAH